MCLLTPVEEWMRGEPLTEEHWSSQMSQALRTASNGAPGTFRLFHPPCPAPPNPLPLSPPASTALGLSVCLTAPGAVLLCESTVHMCELQNSHMQRDAQSHPPPNQSCHQDGLCCYGPYIRALLCSVSESHQEDNGKGIWKKRKKFDVPLFCFLAWCERMRIARSSTVHCSMW